MIWWVTPNTTPLQTHEHSPHKSKWWWHSWNAGKTEEIWRLAGADVFPSLSSNVTGGPLVTFELSASVTQTAVTEAESWTLIGSWRGRKQKVGLWLALGVVRWTATVTLSQSEGGTCTNTWRYTRFQPITMQHFLVGRKNNMILMPTNFDSTPQRHNNYSRPTLPPPPTLPGHIRTPRPAHCPGTHITSRLFCTVSY